MRHDVCRILLTSRLELAPSGLHGTADAPQRGLCRAHARGGHVRRSAAAQVLDTNMWSQFASSNPQRSIAVPLALLQCRPQPVGVHRSAGGSANLSNRSLSDASPSKYSPKKLTLTRVERLKWRGLPKRQAPQSLRNPPEKPHLWAAQAVRRTSASSSRKASPLRSNIGYFNNFNELQISL